MQKSVSLAVMGLMVIMMMGAVSATEYILVAGKIYNADFTNTIEGADVTVTCSYLDVTTVKNTVSLADGTYSVKFEEHNGVAYTECRSDISQLTVSAVKGSLYGSQTGVIHDDSFAGWDLAIVNVPLVPEFGLIVGMVTILGAIGVFFVVRRK